MYQTMLENISMPSLDKQTGSTWQIHFTILWIFNSTSTKITFHKNRFNQNSVTKIRDYLGINRTSRPLKCSFSIITQHNFINFWKKLILAIYKNHQFESIFCSYNYLFTNPLVIFSYLRSMYKYCYQLFEELYMDKYWNNLHEQAWTYPVILESMTCLPMFLYFKKV